VENISRDEEEDEQDVEADLKPAKKFTCAAATSIS
jgi:hypothetical protein